MTNFSKLNWQTIEHYDENNSSNEDSRYFIQRAVIHGGWLVRAEYRHVKSSIDGHNGGLGIGESSGIGVGLTFVPDPNHDWLLT